MFQLTVGAAAFLLFVWQGRVQHDLSEPIPGSPTLDPAVDAQTALTHLHDVITAFHRHTGALHPHFAYGALSKAQYELANAMHLANHLSAFDVSPVV